MGKSDRVLLVVLGISLAVNVGLAFLWQQSKRTAQGIVTRTASSHLMPVEGEYVPELHLVKPDGTKVDLRLDTREPPVVLYIFSPTCKWCDLNRPNIDSLVSQSHNRYRFIGLYPSTTGISDYLMSNAVPFPVYSLDPSSPNPEISESVTPRTLLFSSGGLLVHSWTGAYSGATMKQISSAFGVRFPRE
jgi:hypothetical protein